MCYNLHNLVFDHTLEYVCYIFITDETLALSKGGMINRIRSYLEKAIRISSVTQCPLVWRMYLLSEVICINIICHSMNIGLANLCSD